MAGVDLTYANMNMFLNALFAQFSQLKHLNMSSTRIKSLWSTTWPSQIAHVDLSHNLIDDLDCAQFYSAPSLHTLSLSHNRLSSFSKFLNSCASILNQTRGITFDLSHNLFESIDAITTSGVESCGQHLNITSLILHGNPLVCDCEENNWWSHIDARSGLSPDLFYAQAWVILFSDSKYAFN